MTQPSTSSQPQLRTKYKRERTFEPIYTGGAATALSPDGNYLFAPVNETIHITHVTSGKTVNRIPSDLEEVSCLALSSDGAMLLVASRSLAVRVIQLDYSTDAETGFGVVSWHLQRSMAKTHDAPVVVMSIDPTNTLLATGSSDGCAKVWDIRGGFCTHVYRNHGGIVSALAWNMPSSVGGSARAADRTIELFTGSMDGNVRLWDLKAAASKGPQRPAAVLEAHFSVVRGLSVCADGTRLVSAGRDRLVAFWEKGRQGRDRKADSGNWRLVDSVTTSESIESAGFLTDSNEAFYTGGAEGELRLWSFARHGITTVQPMGRFAKGVVKRRSAKSADDDENGEEEDDETRGITHVHALPLLNSLVSVHADQNILFRSLPTLSLTRRLVGFNDQIIDMALLSSSEGPDSHLAVATNTNSISVYTLGSEEHSVELLPSETAFEQGHTGLVLCLDKTSDGQWLASGAKDRSVRVWARVPKMQHSNGVAPHDDVGERLQQTDTAEDDEREWRCVAVAEGHTESVGAVAFARRPSAPGATGAPFLVSGSQDRTAKVWDLSTLQAAIDENQSTPLRLTSLTTLKIHDKDINALDVSPNNALLLSGSQDKTAKVFSINYSPPSKANSHAPTAALKLVATCRGHKRGVWSVAFSPNDAVFLTGSGDRSLKLWSITNDFSCIKNYIGHTNSILKVRFLKGSAGLQCVSCASDGLVKVWNVKTEECIDTLDGHEDRVWGLECSQDGDFLVSGAADSLVCFWRDWTQKDEEEKVRERQDNVEREQQFANLLAVKDYRNAISLALAMNQPRRLLSLFTTVDASRLHGDGSTSTGQLLDSALHVGGGASGIDPSLQALVGAGVLSMASAAVVAGGDNSSTSTITGSPAVDHVIETLAPDQLMTLLSFVRDWNTSARTSHVAQIVLHAILRFHSADAIIEAYDEGGKAARQSGQGEDGDGGEDMEGNGRQRRAGAARKRQNADLKAVVDALLPYTKRHYDRAQRLLTESAMLQYTLSCMDSVLGAEVSDETREGVDVVMLKPSEHVNGESDEEEEADEDAEMASDDASDE